MHQFTFIASSLLWCQLTLIAQHQQAAQAFWLTDSTLFQRPFVPPPPQLVSDTSQNAVATTNASINNAITSQNSRVEPWIRVSADNGASVTTVTAAPTLSSDAPSQQTCQCNADWLQGQTSLWLNKWIGSASFAQHLQQSLAKLSNGSSANGGAHRRLAWNRASKRHSNGGPRDSGAKIQSGQQQAPSKMTPVGGQQLELAGSQLKPVKVMQGERGPKGEQGERGPIGERGLSGPISVKDRDALFDLPAATADGPVLQPTASAAAQQQRRLAFVEAEQLLVVETPLGWRPIQMLPALRDFRKTIAKFSLSSQEQRLRLLNQNGDVENRLLARLLNVNSHNKLVSSNSKRVRSKMNTILAVGGDEVEDEEDEKEDEEDEEDEDEEANQVDKFEDDADDDEDGEEEEDDEEEEDESDNENELNNIEPFPKSAANQNVGWQAAKRLNGVAETKARRHRVGQVSSRSAMAAPVRSETMTTTTASQLDLNAQVARKSQVAGGGGAASQNDLLMKLRLVALNEPFAGNQHGLRGANFECKRHAARANVKGAFRALLATNYQNLNEIVRHSAHVHGNPVVNLRGETLASSWHDLLRSPARMANPLSRILSFDGRHVASDPNWPNKLVWLGASGKLGNRDATQNCDGWHSDSLNKFGFASPLHSPRNNHLYLQFSKTGGKHHRHQRGAELDRGNASSLPFVFDAIDKYPCRMPLIVLCIETIAQGGQQY